MADNFAVPRSILRGHKTQVHAARFIRQNRRLVTGDADGFIIAWDLTILRPRATWKAHTKAILGIGEWGDDRLITHGRDNEIIVWQFREEDEENLGKFLPVQDVPEAHAKPWMQHVLPVNSMNFCAFASCERGNLDLGPAASVGPESSELLIAAPNALALEAVDIFSLPSQHRIFTVRPSGVKGMSMALALAKPRGALHLVAAYESGMATVSRLNHVDGEWTTLYRHAAHTQPILSLDVSPSLDFFLTSAADAVIAKHPLSPELPGSDQQKDTRTKIAGTRTGDTPSAMSGLSAQRASTASEMPTSSSSSSSTPAEMATTPLKIINTKHSGQQSLRIRSDGAIFATAGWDTRVRIYSAKTMREVAVLKWHTVGCFAAAFAIVDGGPDDAHEGDFKGGSEEPDTKTTHKEMSVVAAAPTSSGEAGLTVKERRLRHAQAAHWVAAGGKDGKVSLWEIY